MDTHLEQAKNCFLQGVRLYEAGQFEQAQTQFLASLSLVPGRSSTLMNLGATQIKLGQFAQAVPVLEEALRSQPDDAETRGHLATALAELGRPREALAHAEAALRIHPAAAVLWTLRGNLLKELGRADEAVQAFRQTLAHGGTPNSIAITLRAWSARIRRRRRRAAMCRRCSMATPTDSKTI